MPKCPTASSRPTNGLTYVAPHLAAIMACSGENVTVTLVLMPSRLSAFTAFSPS